MFDDPVFVGALAHIAGVTFYGASSDITGLRVTVFFDTYAVYEQKAFAEFTWNLAASWTRPWLWSWQTGDPALTGPVLYGQYMYGGPTVNVTVEPGQNQALRQVVNWSLTRWPDARYHR
jgi:hypothetical protein